MSLSRRAFLGSAAAASASLGAATAECPFHYRRRPAPPTRLLRRPGSEVPEHRQAGRPGSGLRARLLPDGALLAFPNFFPHWASARHHAGSRSHYPLQEDCSRCGHPPAALQTERLLLPRHLQSLPSCRYRAHHREHERPGKLERCAGTAANRRLRSGGPGAARKGHGGLPSGSGRRHHSSHPVAGHGKDAGPRRVPE